MVERHAQESQAHITQGVTVTPADIRAEHETPHSLTRSPSGLFWLRQSGIGYPNERYIPWLQAAQRFMALPLLDHASSAMTKIESCYTPMEDKESPVPVFRVCIWAVASYAGFHPPHETSLESLPDREAEVAVTGRLYLPPIPNRNNTARLPLIEVCDGVEAHRLSVLLVQSSKLVQFAFPQMITKMTSGFNRRRKG